MGLDDEKPKRIGTAEDAAKVKKIPTSKRDKRESQRNDRSVNIQQPEQTKGPYLNGLKDPTPDIMTYGGIKLGWIQGVLIPCLLNIWGVMLFLRIAWIVAQAGIMFSIIIILISATVCVITTLSLSAICTNGELRGGGVYYLVSRSLGAELGASVGIMFAFANAVAASMNTIGFCDSLNELLEKNQLKIIDNSVNDTRIIGTITILILCLICAVGMDWESLTQNFLIVIIVTAIINYLIGALVGPKSLQEKAQGFVGISMKVIKENWNSDFRVSEGTQHDFFSIFAMYFPAVTGVQSGANICGDLKNPATAIPKGTLLAVAVSTTSYLMIAVLSGSGALRDASGDTANVTHEALSSCKPNCTYGLHNNYIIMHQMALWGPLIYGGCWAATLSTALTNLLSVPRLIQALGIDRIYPCLFFFSKRYGKHGEPYRGYVLTFLVSASFLIIANLNTIAPLITNFYLASYSLINFCTFHASFVGHHSWRPTFQCHNTWLSLFGCLCCIGIMIMISWVMTIATCIIFFFLYFVVLYRNPDVNWGSSTDAKRYQDIVSSLVQMTHRLGSIKSYNPQLLVLAGEPFARPALLDIGHAITRMGSFMIVAEIQEKKLTFEEHSSRSNAGNEWLAIRNNRGFFVVLDNQRLHSGVSALLKTTGLGRLSPNILLIGFKRTWMTISDEELNNYIEVLQCAFKQKIALIICRVDSSHPATANLKPTEAKVNAADDHVKLFEIMRSDSEESNKVSQKTEASARPGNRTDGTATFLPKPNSSSSTKDAEKSYKKPLTFKHGDCLDVWWLYDDGGLNILISYIIARKGNMDMRLRIFALAKESYSPEEAKKYMEESLSKFRIYFTSLLIVSCSDTAPSTETEELFKSFFGSKLPVLQKFLWFRHCMEHFVCHIFFGDSFQEIVKCCMKIYRILDVFVTSVEINDAKKFAQIFKHFRKTQRHLRLRELLLSHSADAALIVLTLPLPRKGLVTPAVYMSWLEVLSRGLPPMLLIRGSAATKVLTSEA